jgi:hypothetical protein
MKPIILTFLFAIIFASLHAQNTISITYYPTDNGIGARYDRQINNYGGYLAASKGNYQISETKKIDNHVKLVAGILRYIERDGISGTYVSLGVSYHQYSNRIIGLP